MNTLLKIVIVFTFSAVILSNLLGKGWLVYHEGSFKGRVVDGQSKEPIEGAVVVAVYHIRKYGLGAGIMSDSTAIAAKETLTNKNGEFHIRPHIFVSLWPFAKGETTEFIVYKPGYTDFPGFDYMNYFPSSPLHVDISTLEILFRKGVAVDLMKLRTEEERLRCIPSSPTDMGVKELPLLYEAINEENKRFGLGEVK